MSVIFQALQKLEPERGDTARSPDGFDGRLTVGTPRRRLLPRLVRVALLAGLLVGLGFGAVHGVRWLRDGTPRTAEATSHPVRHAIPLTAGKVPVQASGVGTVQTRPNPARTRYYPPGSSGKAAAVAVPAAATAEAFAQASPEEVPNQPDIPMAPAAESRPAPVPTATEKEPVSLPGEADPAPDLPSKETPSPEQGRDLDPAWLAAEAARVAAIEKNARIGRLVRRIEASIQASGNEVENPADQGATEALLGELARLKGEDSAYVNKLRAYRLMKTGQYEKAEPVLRKILAADAFDLEAGLNLAVVLINTGRPAQAGRWLGQLREVYPDNGTVADLLRRVKR
jgi:hypothetical protein